MSTANVLIVFLMTIALVCVGTLYLDLRHKNQKLKKEIAKLEATQVLLMVPDEQAKALADWLAANPAQAMALLKQAKPGEQTSVSLIPSVGPDLQPDSNLPSADNVNLVKSTEANNVVSDSKTQVEPKTSPSTPVVLSENADGVKVIELPHGGIRVTTRDEKKQ